jgi:DNA-binding NarL/FixJ family response regulator
MSKKTQDIVGIKVFIVEDEILIRKALRQLVEQHNRLSFWGDAEDVDDAIDKLTRILLKTDNGGNNQLPHVILLDMNFRTKTGRDVLKGTEFIMKIDNMRRSIGDMDVKILCISNNINPDVVVAAIEAGAQGYLDKQQAHEGWLQAVEKVFDGYQVFSPNIAEKIMFTNKFTHLDNIEIFYPKEDLGLGPRALDVAFLRFRCGKSAKEIAEDLGIKEATVRYHLNNIKRSAYMTVAFGKSVHSKRR